ncbi:hypothetical protein BROUX41_005859 [Berkeleyomyces rouxiae]|uniref:uncharacterized protein n=1 Tax=Berkeleyomyces rouxiae TaxID=2035830 RepID=UPI003B771F36
MAPSKSHEDSHSIAPTSTTPLLASLESSKRSRYSKSESTLDGKKRDRTPSKLPKLAVTYTESQLLPTPDVSERDEPVTLPPDEPFGNGDAPHRLLSNSEWRVIAESVGALTNSEDGKLSHPSNGCWPPRGMPPGLYRDIVFLRAKYFYLYHAVVTIQWAGMILQLFLSASLTAIGSMKIEDTVIIT